MPTSLLLYYVIIAGGCLVLSWLIARYAKALSGAPIALWLIFGYKIAETTAYSLGSNAMRISLRKDTGLSDIGASDYYLLYTILISVFGIAAGAFTDTLGVKRMTLVSIGFLFVSRLCMGVVNEPYLLFITAYFPMAIGMAIVAPVVSVSVKKLTTKETAPMGFALYYILMNAGFAIGGWGFDTIRETFSQKDSKGVVIHENAGADWLGHHFSTYKIVFLSCIIGTAVSLLLILPMRRRLPGEEDIPEHPAQSMMASASDAFRKTFNAIRAAASERFFLTFLGITTLLLFVQAASRQFSLTFTDYGVRVLGEGAKVGSLYGVLNPVLILFFVPLIAAITKRVSSINLIIIGSTISTLSCFIVAIPGGFFEPLSRTMFGEMMLIHWLKLAPDAQALAATPPHPAYWPLIFFIMVFTLGEALWSPRFYQFTAEIAPKGKEATYLSLAILPTFASKFIVAAMSGRLMNHYTPIDPTTKAILPHPDHYMIWVWVGVSAALTPVGMLVCRRIFDREIKLVQEKNANT